MILTRKSTYGLKALITLARRSEQGVILISELAREAKIPKKFLEAILLALKNGGVLRSKIGKGGGYTLAIPAQNLSIGRIIRILEGDYAPINCLSSTNNSRCDECSSELSCGIRLVMADVQQAMSSVFETVMLADVIERSEATKLQQSNVLDYSI